MTPQVLNINNNIDNYWEYIMSRPTMSMEECYKQTLLVDDDKNNISIANIIIRICSRL